jgi:hypothetical protein
VTVPVEPAPTVTVDGLSARPETVGAAGGGGAAFTVRTALWLVPPPVAVMVGEPALDVETANEAVVDPAGTVTEAGTLAALLELDSETAIPPDGAAAEIVTVPVEPVPAVTVDGLKPSAATVGAGGGEDGNGSSVSVAVRVTPPPDTEMSTSVRVETARVEMMKPPAAANCGTVTEPGTRTMSGRELESVKVMSALRGSAAVTRPFEPDEPEVVVGSSVIDVGAGCGVSVVDA